MEEFSLLTTGAGNTRGSAFIHLPSSTTAAATAAGKTPAPAAVPPQLAGLYGRIYHPMNSSQTLSPKPEAGSSNHSQTGLGEISPREVDSIKTKIMSHPQYPALIEAFINCQKVGAPPEVVDRLSVVSRELEMNQSGRQKSSPDPELDQFMEAYCDMLMKYKEELTRPIQEIALFFKSVEAQLNSLSSNAPDEKREGVGSSEKEQDTSGGELGGQNPEIDNCVEDDKELKKQLLKKYNGYLSSLWKELSKKKKRGKLPKEARQKLLNWWELHYKWPYPSETEKVALAESTGLDQKQINNWFINQRKRHWKPSEDMQFVVMDGSYPQNPSAAAFYMNGQFMGDSLFHQLGP